MTDLAARDDNYGEGDREAPQVEAARKFPGVSDGASSHEGWRTIAKQVQSETDSARLMDLAQQLIDEFDRIQMHPPKPAPASADSITVALPVNRCTTTGQQEDGSSDGDHDGTARAEQ
jgi:hypothetical protein